MGLTKRKGTFYVEFRVSQERGHLTLAQNGQGKMKRWKVGSLNRECARNQEALIKTRLLAGTEKIASREKPILFEEWADRYLGMKEVRELASFRDRKRHIEWFKQRFKGRTLSSISVDDVTEFREELDDLATQTINHYHAALKHLLGLAAGRQYKLIPSNNAAEVPMPDPKNQRNEMLSVEEWAALRAELATHLRDIVLVAYTCGPRKGEILTLEWPNVDLKQRAFVLNKTKNGEPRTVPMLTDEVYETFLRLSKVRRLDTKRVFLYEGKSVAGIKTGFMAACRRAGVYENHEENGFTFHDLRHCAATNMRRAGIPTSVVMKIMGWKSIEMYKRYDKIEPRDFHQASTALSAYLETNTVITPARFQETAATVSV